MGEKITQKELKPYIEGIKELNKFGVDYIVMVCNTIHLFYKPLQKESKAPIIDLRKAVLRELNSRKIKSVLVLGTSQTTKKLYKFKNIKTTTPTKKEQKIITNSILLFNNGIRKKEQASKVMKICQNYLPYKAEIVLTGCTELELMLRNKKMQKIEPMNVLVSELMEKIAITRELKTQKEVII